MSVFDSVFGEVTTGGVNFGQFLGLVAVGLIVGLWYSFVYTRKTQYTNSFILTLTMLPAVVAVVIMMVNGNVGAGVAVAGAFSLVRFRSVPGSARDIGTIFLAMGTGLIIGMGFVAYAALFAVVMGVAMMLFTYVFANIKRKPCLDKALRITIPEDINYGDAFDDVFNQYTSNWETISVKTTNMGSLYKINYHVTLKDASKEKEFIDALRCRNGNLEISISRVEVNVNEL